MDQGKQATLRAEFDKELHELILLVSQGRSEDTIDRKLKELLTRFGPHENNLPPDGYGLLYDVEHLLMGINRKEGIISDYFEYQFKHKDPSREAGAP